MTKETQEVTLDNGSKAVFHKEDIDTAKIQEYEAVCSERAAGSAPHFSVGQALLNEIAKDEEKQALIIGKLGRTKVLDSSAVAQDILNTYIQANNYSIEKVRVAGSKTTASKKLEAIKNAVGSNPEFIAALKAAGITL
jgi:hypothetical protein